MSRVAAIKTHRANFKNAYKQIFALADQVDAKVSAIREDESLTPEQRKFQIEKVRDKARETWRKLSDEAAYSLECATDLIRKTRLDVKPRQEDRERVTKLLEQGTAPSDILERATQQRDENTVIALRWAMHYYAPADGKLADADNLILACDRSLSKIAVGQDERARSSASVELANAKSGLETVRRYGLKGVEGSAKGKPLMEAAYAMADQAAGGSDGDA